MDTNSKKTYAFVAIVTGIITLAVYGAKLTVPHSDTVVTKQNKNIDSSRYHIIASLSDSTDESDTNTEAAQPIDDRRQINYQEAVEQFTGRRLQINNCEITPRTVTFANDTEIMLDSKSSEGQRLILGNHSIILDGYEAAFITLEAAELPTTLSVDCEWLGGQLFNTAEIIIQ